MFLDPVSYWAAFIAGLLSFFSPCVLPLIPAYFTFISGFSLEELTTLKGKDVRKKVMLSTCSYVLGFSLIFILMGASASYLGNLLYRYVDYIRIGGGVMIIILGVHLTGLFRFRALDFEKRLHLEKKPLHFFGTFLVGMAFAAGWSPCIGPLLGSILIIASSKETVLQGITLLGLYSAGLAIPFLILSCFVNLLLFFIKKAVKALKYLNPAAGVLLVLIGVMLIFNKLNFFSSQM
ncbi:MAG: cytochrome c biogenesis protein CcdA [Pseudomonadota bacterium]